MVDFNVVEYGEIFIKTGLRHSNYVDLYACFFAGKAF